MKSFTSGLVMFYRNNKDINSFFIIYYLSVNILFLLFDYFIFILFILKFILSIISLKRFNVRAF